MEENLLIIVGKISKVRNSYSVRVLFDCIENNKNISVKLNDINYKITLGDKSLVYVFDNLAVNTEYRGVATLDNKDYIFTFNTTLNPNIVFISCCGYYTLKIDGVLDNDSSTIDNLQKEPYDVMIHMGDQLYSDIIKKKCSGGNYVKQYRNIYRKVFGSTAMQKILRKGSHIMICDDHEFYNNTGSKDKENPWCVAGQQMYLEYQESLSNTNYTNCKLLNYNDKNIIIPNLRYESIFNYKKSTPYISDELQNTVIKSLDKSKMNILITSVPIIQYRHLYQNIFEFLVDRYKNKDKNNLYIYAKNTERFLDHLRKSQCNLILVGGDSHLSSNSNITYNDITFAKQYISSGISRSCSSIKNVPILLKIKEILMDYFNYPRYPDFNFKSDYRSDYVDRYWANNYTIIYKNNKVKQYKGDNLNLTTYYYYKHFYIITILFLLLIFFSVYMYRYLKNN